MSLLGSCTVNLRHVLTLVPFWFRYYAYQVTGDQYWRDVAWAYTLAQNRIERVGSGFSSIVDVLTPSGNGTQNFMASYMLAEDAEVSVPHPDAEEGDLGCGIWAGQQELLCLQHRGSSAESRGKGTSVDARYDIYEPIDEQSRYRAVAPTTFVKLSDYQAV